MGKKRERELALQVQRQRHAIEVQSMMLDSRNRVVEALTARVSGLEDELARKQPKPLPKREYKAINVYGEAGISYDAGLGNFLNSMAADGWEFIQMSGTIAIFRREQ